MHLAIGEGEQKHGKGEKKKSKPEESLIQESKPCVSRLNRPGLKQKRRMEEVSKKRGDCLGGGRLKKIKIFRFRGGKENIRGAQKLLRKIVVAEKRIPGNKSILSATLI